MAIGLGRRTAVIRTPQLVRDYLNGVPFPDGVGGVTQIDPADGEYISRIHQHVKRRIKEIVAERRDLLRDALEAAGTPRRQIQRRVEALGYQYPRAHSFKSLLFNMTLLGLGAPTDRFEPGKPHLRPRHWYRLAPGAAAREEWRDPLGYLRAR